MDNAAVQQLLKDSLSINIEQNPYEETIVVKLLWDNVEISASSLALYYFNQEEMQ